jgi:thymidylate synthase ThyX
MSGTLRSWIHYIDVRAEEGTQKEHRLIALAAQGEILKHFPSLNEYWYPEGALTGYDELAFKQQLLGKEFEKVLYDNLDDLYVTDDKPKSWWWKFWS